MTYDHAQLLLDLNRDEGLRLKPYVDTVGKITIGVGHNLSDLGITAKMAQILLEEDVANTERNLLTALPWVDSLPPGVLRGLLNIAYNIGITALQSFHKALAKLEAHDYPGAADEFLASQWARQVGPGRSGRVTGLIRLGL